MDNIANYNNKYFNQVEISSFRLHSKHWFSGVINKDYYYYIYYFSLSTPIFNI